jgi:zinc protease
MIQYSEFKLKNGLKVIVHEDHTTPLVSMNILYNVGSRDENKEHTGLAHLFEHLMFSGSVNIPEYDTPLQLAGGTNNAFTNTDITNYYLTLPAENIETAFWLESDRMLSLGFSQQALDVQKNVVVEEFRQRYLNQPYGDMWLNLRKQAFKVHPYQWATIGKSIEHVEKTQIDDIKYFFKKFYNPSNAILSLSGNISLPQAKELCVKWFEPIPNGNINTNNYPQEPDQTNATHQIIEANVPASMIVIAFKNVSRNNLLYYAADLFSDLIGRAESSRLYNALVREKEIFNSINSYVTGESDEGLFVIEGKTTQGVNIKHAEKELWDAINAIIYQNKITSQELQKVKNKSLTAYHFALTNSQNIALSLALSANLGNTNQVNEEPSKIEAVSLQEIQLFAENYIQLQKSNTLIYLSKEQDVR